MQSISSPDSSIFDNFYHHSAPFCIMRGRRSKQHLEQVLLEEPQ